MAALCNSVANTCCSSVPGVPALHLDISLQLSHSASCRSLTHSVSSVSAGVSVPYSRDSCASSNCWSRLQDMAYMSCAVSWPASRTRSIASLWTLALSAACTSSLPMPCPSPGCSSANVCCSRCVRAGVVSSAFELCSSGVYSCSIFRSRCFMAVER